MTEKTDVAIVGGGPAGAALAIHLARAGIQATVIERRKRVEWHACGVFSSPLTRRRLADLGFSTAEIARLNRPISALNLETTRGASCRIEYANGHACGFDRTALDTALLVAARRAGASIRMATVVSSVELPASAGDPARLAVSSIHTAKPDEERIEARLEARLVVGADGPASIVARAANVYAKSRFLWKSGITFHRRDPSAAPRHEPMEGRFLFGRDWYVGIAPVPTDRVNIGMVVPPAWLRAASPAALSDSLFAQFPGVADPWMSGRATDQVEFAGRLEHHVRSASGRGFLLIGDAIEFIDPLTGEGLHRAFVSAELAADSIAKVLRGDPNALAVYDRRIRARWRSKNVVSWVLQAFLSQPAAFDYALRRLATRDRLREQLTLVLTDQSPASGVIDPRYLLRLLAP